jgi:hypothetical protein
MAEKATTAIAPEPGLEGGVTVADRGAGEVPARR